MRAGASSGQPAEGHRRRWRTVRARWPPRSLRARRSDGRNRAVWAASDPGLGGVLPELTRGRRKLVPPPAYCGGAQRALPRAAGALLPVRLLAAAADLAAGGVRTLPGPRLRGNVFLRVPRGAILLPVMAGSAQRRNSAVYVGAFCGSEEGGCWTPFQGYAEAGYRAQQDVHKTALCIDRARSIHKLIPVTRPCLKFPSGILRRRARRA